MSGSKVTAFSGRNKAAFLGPNLVPGSWFGMPALAEGYILRPTSVKHILRGYKTLQEEPKHVFIAQLVQIIQHFS